MPIPPSSPRPLPLNKPLTPLSQLIQTSGLPAATLQPGADATQPLQTAPVSSFSPSGITAAGSASPTAAFLSIESIPESTKINYQDFSRQLKANPRVDYIEIDRKDLNKGLSQFLNQYKEALDAKPELREKLAQSPAGQALLEALDHAAKGQLGTADVLKLQTFIIASGVDISHKNSATGVDGDYGPRTHAGLQQAFAQILDTPDQAIASFESNYVRAQEYATNEQTDRQGLGNMFVPGQSSYSEAVAEELAIPTSSTDMGLAITQAARKSQPQMARTLASLQAQSGRKHYRCYQGVKQVLNQLQPPISLSGGSAYQAAAQLRSQYSDRFSDIRSFDPNSASTKSMLRNLPAGAVVVWGRNESASKRSANPNNGYSHGHISVAMGGGREYSDRYRSQITNNDNRYSSVTVFYPK